MGVLTDYFTAPSDEAAAATIDWDGGPSRPDAQKRSVLRRGKALELAPDMSSTHDALGRVALARSRSREAEGHFREALRIEPEDPVALNNLGLALLRQGRRRAAVAYFASASKANPHDDLARRNAVVATIGVGGATAAVIAAQVVARSSRGSTTGLIIAGMVFVIVIVLAGVRQHRLARIHNDPQASKELMRSLRPRRA